MGCTGHSKKRQQDDADFWRRLRAAILEATRVVYGDPPPELAGQIDDMIRRAQLEHQSGEEREDDR